MPASRLDASTKIILSSRLRVHPTLLLGKNALSLLAWRTRTSGASSDSQAIAEATGGTLPGGAKQAEELLKEITSEQYQFAYINSQAQPGKIWHRGWEPIGL